MSATIILVLVFSPGGHVLLTAETYIIMCIHTYMHVHKYMYIHTCNCNTCNCDAALSLEY